MAGPQLQAIHDEISHMFIRALPKLALASLYRRIKELDARGGAPK